MNIGILRSRIGVITLSLLAITIGLSACTQKRPQSFTQGQGLNLDPVAKWAPHFYDIETGKVIGTTPTTNAQEKVVVDPSVKSMNHYDLVELKIADESVRTLVGSPPFRAKADQPKGVYQLEIRLTDNYLKIYKVGKPEDLPFDEHFYTEETLKDGRIAIPIVGYKIKAYYRVEAQKTNDDQDSQHLMEIKEDDPSKASYVRIDWATREVFEPIKKVDLFPADFFFATDPKTGKMKPYEWYYSETVTEKSLKDTTTVVGDSGVRDENSKLNPATKVMFLPREGELRVINVARDERLTRDAIQDGADLDAEATMLLPVKWRNYRTKADGSALSLKGEVVEEVKWNERKFFEIDFLSIESAAILNGGRQLTDDAGTKKPSVYQTGTNRLLDMEIDANYFSFTIMNMMGSNGRKIHYSFLRADNGRLAYTPKRSFKDDRNTFGFFSTTKPFYPNWEYYTQNDFDKRDFMSRMNPNQKEIVFHLSFDSPKSLYDVTERSIQAWDRAFQEALKGTGREMHIKFSRDPVQLGDLRYNVIHLVDTLQEDGLLGFGPSVADPETGEIVAGTTNIYVNSFRSISAQTVRQYMINRLEKRLKFKDESNSDSSVVTDNQPMPSISTVADPMSLAAMTATPKTRDQLMFDRFLKFDGSNLAATDKKWAELFRIDQKTEKQLRDQFLGQRCQYAANIASNTSDEEIRKNCPEIEKLVSAHLADNFVARDGGADNWERVWADSAQAIRQCSDKITEEKLLSTLIHEVGHNFGLRHNFYGSIDKANFRQVKDSNGKEITPQSSSIMEYTVWEEDRLTEAGKYDIAAIRFGYGDTVDLNQNEGGKSIALDNTKSIAQNMKELGKTKDAIKPYLFCTDEEAYTSMNALCRPHDSGTTPAKIVDYFIAYYQRLQELREFRRVRPTQYTSSPEAYAADNLSRIFIPLKEIYDQWRYEYGQYIRKSNRYLTQYKTKVGSSYVIDDKAKQIYLDDLKRMREDPAYKAIYDQYYEPAQKVYKFFRDIAFGSNQYCVIQESTGRSAIEFERLRDMLSESTRGAIQIRTCADAADVASMSSLATLLGDKSPQIVGETGAPVNSYRYDPATTLEENLTDDVIGNNATRTYAAIMLGYRNTNPRNILNTFMPSMIDEPDHYLELRDLFVNRVTQGVILPKALQVEGVVPVFEQETPLFSSMITNLRKNLIVPNSTLSGVDYDSSYAKLNGYIVYIPDVNESLSKYSNVLGMNGRAAFASAGDEKDYAYQLIEAYNAADEKLSTPTVPAKIVPYIAPAIKKALPTAAELPTMKVKKLVDIFKFAQGIAGSYGDVFTCVQKATPKLATLNPIFNKLIKDKVSVLRKVLGMDATAITADEQAFLDQVAIDYLKASGITFASTQEDVAGFEPAIEPCANAQNLKASRLGRYSKDYTSQKTLILNALSTFAK
ncbi:MAG: zinc-dependent metalloprotease [Bdellovibrionales bacterium]|nr:zinc-dependent metalloprotease [Bdellovibrionales bacterium]